MLDLVLAISISFLVCYLSIPAIINIAKLKKLYDVPDARKVHINPVASLGGIGIFAGFSIALLVSTTFSEGQNFQYILAATLIMFFVGIKDDILVISPAKKFLGQVVAALILIFKGDIRIESLSGFLGIETLNPIVSVVLTFFTILTIVNSFNLIDGVDGLAGSLALITAVLVGGYFLYTGLTAYALLAFCLSGSLVGFLYYNYQPAKIFMGDTGSLIIGLVCSTLVIKFMSWAPGNAVMPLEGAAGLGFSLLLLPMMDLLRVFTIRVSRGNSPFKADRKHIHHFLLDKGLSHRQIALTLSLFSLGMVVLSYSIRSVGTTGIVLVQAGTYFGTMLLISYLPTPKISTSTLEVGTNGIYQLEPLRKMELPKKAVAE